MVRGIACAGWLRTTFDGMRRAVSLSDAVVFADMTLAAGVVGYGQLVAYVELHRGWRGVRQAREALALAVTASASPPETRMRLIWVLDAGIPVYRVNQPVFDLGGRLLGIADGLDLESATVVEYDGDDHRGIVQHSADNLREERFEEHGLTVMRATRLDLGRNRQPLAERMRRTRARGLSRDRTGDRWTITPPPGWRGWR